MKEFKLRKRKENKTKEANNIYLVHLNQIEEILVF